MTFSATFPRNRMRRGRALAVLMAIAMGTGPVIAEEVPLSAQASDPRAMGWMQGFPPAPDKTIRFTDPDYFAFPKLRWTVCHFRDLMPSVAVARGPDAIRLLEAAPDATLDAVRFTPLNGRPAMTWGAAFDANYTDGVIVMHHGRVVYERYAGCLDAATLHGAMSVTKSLTGLLAEVLVAEGTLDPAAIVGDLIPELKASAFGSATMRDVMDMTTALDYSEDYADPDAEVWAYAKAGSPLPKPEGYDGPRGYFEYLETVKQKGTHGEAFGYKTVNADALGWLVARASGRSVADLLSDRVWSHLGAEREAFYTVDGLGTPFAGGGFNATLRDMARLGQMMLDGGRVGDAQVVPEAAVAAIAHGGDPALFAKADYTLLPEWSYGSMWWVSRDDHGAYAARGVHGQTIWVDPAADMVIARFASTPVAANAWSDPTSLPAFRAIADHLMANDDAPLLGRPWRIEAIDGRGVIDMSPASLQFLPNGRLAGNTTCNRLIARWEETDGALTLSPAGSTMMACPPALMEQEARLLALLPSVARYSVDETGALVLSTRDGRTITAHR